MSVSSHPKDEPTSKDRSRSWFVIVVALCVSAAASASAPDLPRLLAAERRLLPNGLEILVREDHRLPLVMLCVVYHAGALNDPPGLSGLAHLVEHLMFEGSAHADSSYLARLGSLATVDANGFTRPDFTQYLEVLPPANLEAGLWLESDRMGFLAPALNDIKLARAKEVVKNERRQRVDLAPYGLAAEVMDQALFPAPHPFFGHGIGTESNVDRATLVDIRAFLAEWYRPSNATVALVGDFQTDAAMKLVARYFLDLPSSPRPPAPVIGEVQLDREVRLDHVERSGAMPAVFVGWHSPAIFAPGDEVAELLGVILTRRLERRLVIGQRIAQQVSAWQSSQAGQSFFTARAMAVAGTTPEQLLAGMDGELQRIRLGDLSDADLAEALAWQQTEMLERFDSSLQIEHVADWMQIYNHHLGRPDWFTDDLARFARVRTADVVRFAREALPSGRRVVVLARPARAASR
jgi:zinc protease